MTDDKKEQEVKEEVKQPEEKNPCEGKDSTCTQRWIDSLSDCA